MMGVAGGGGFLDGAGCSARGSIVLLVSTDIGTGIGSTGGKVEESLSKVWREAADRAIGTSGRACGAGGCMGVVGTAVLATRLFMAGALLL